MSRAATGVLLVAAALAAGCSSQDFGGATGRVGEVIDPGRPAMTATDEEEAQLRSERLARVMAYWQQQNTGEVEDYRVGAEDVLDISVTSLESPGEVTTLSRDVSRDGSVDMPLIKQLPVGGLTAREIEVAVTKAYDNRYLKDPEVSVTVSEYRSSPVVMMGSLSRPGVYFLRRNSSTVLEMLSQAEGLSSAAGDTLYVVHAEGLEDFLKKGEASDAPVQKPASPDEPDAGADGEADETVNSDEKTPRRDDAALGGLDSTNVPSGEVAGSWLDASADDTGALAIDLRRLLDEGDIRLNVKIKGGDIVSVPPAKIDYIYVLGYVNRPGSFDIEEGREVGVLQAVAMAGGLSPVARAKNSILIMDRPEGRLVEKTDLKAIANGKRPTVYMSPGDTLIVGSDMFAKMAEFFKPTLGASATVTPGM